MRTKIRSSFFYVLFSGLGGIFSALLLSFYLFIFLQLDKKILRLLLFLTFLYLTLTFILYQQALSQLLAPFDLKTLLTQGSPRILSSSLAVVHCLLFLKLLSKEQSNRLHKKLASDLAPPVAALFLGSMINLLVVYIVYFLFY